jgi:D-3-phosphoglycerate dehydrogenase
MKAIFLELQRSAGSRLGNVLSGGMIHLSYVNRKTFARDELPRIIGGYDIAIDDHSYMPTPLVAQCPELKHIVFFWVPGPRAT